MAVKGKTKKKLFELINDKKRRAQSRRLKVKTKPNSPNFNLVVIIKNRKAGYRCLLASEVVQLLCIVPIFFDFIGKDPGKQIKI